MSKITLKFNASKNENGAVLEHGFFDRENKAELERFFDAREDNIEVTIINEVPDVGFRYVWENYSEPIRQLLLDIKDSNSATCKYLADFAGNKVEMFNKAFYAFLENRLLMSSGASYDVFYGSGRYTFRAELPRALIKQYYDEGSIYYNKGPMHFDIRKLTKEEFIQYIMPAYYCEIGAWDRAFIRDNEAVISDLRANWIDTLRAGLA